MQYRNGHISTCFNKDTRELCILCIMCLCQSHSLSLVVIYLFVLVIRYCCSFILYIVRFFIRFIIQYNSSLILLLLSFVVHCFKEKSSILILNCLQVFRSRCSSTPNHLYKSINIIQQTPPTLS